MVALSQDFVAVPEAVGISTASKACGVISTSSRAVNMKISVLNVDNVDIELLCIVTLPYLKLFLVRGFYSHHIRHHYTI